AIHQLPGPHGAHPRTLRGPMGSRSRPPSCEREGETLLRAREGSLPRPSGGGSGWGPQHTRVRRTRERETLRRRALPSAGGARRARVTSHGAPLSLPPTRQPQPAVSAPEPMPPSEGTKPPSVVPAHSSPSSTEPSQSSSAPLQVSVVACSSTRPSQSSSAPL